MANQKKSYFLAPSFDWVADNGPVRLGSVIADPAEPHIPKNSPSFDLPKVYEGTQDNWKDEKAKQRNWLLGLWASFIGLLPIEGEASAEHGKETSHKYEFEKMVTKYFIPDDEYVKQRMEDEKVKEYLAISKSRTVYMITGLKIAHNPAAATMVKTSPAFKLKIGANLTGLGVPINVGPDLGFSSTKASTTSFSGGSAFVFAFQLRAIHYKVVRDQVNIKSKDFTKGAWYSGDNGEIITAVEDDVAERHILLPLPQRDVKAEDVALEDEAMKATDDLDGDECEAIRVWGDEIEWEKVV